MYTIRNYWNILSIDIVQKFLCIPSHFDTENYTWRFDIVFFADFFKTFFPKIYIRKYLKQFSTKRLDIAQNFSCLIFLGQNVSKYLLENV